MEDYKDKIEQLKKKMNELNQFKTSLSIENVQDFNRLKSEILSLLDSQQKIRFNQIDFFQEINETDELASDLPF